jgi:hypothetical protein
MPPAKSPEAEGVRGLGKLNVPRRGIQRIEHQDVILVKSREAGIP